MNLRQMEYFVELKRCGTFHAASEKLFVSQPALSQQLRKVEEELGAALFFRSSKGVVPTYEGEKCLATFEKILYEYQQLQEWLKEAGDLRHGRLVIGVPPARALQFLPELIPAFRKEFPSVELVIHEIASFYLGEALKTGAIDVALLMTEDHALEFVFHPLVREELFLAVPPGSPIDGKLRECFAREEKVDFSLVREEPFIVMPKGSHHREELDRLFAKYKITPTIAMESKTIDLAVRLAGAGMGCSLVSTVFLYFAGKDGLPSAYPLRHEIEPYRIGLAYHPEHYESPVMKAFIDFVREAFHRYPFGV